MKKRGRGNKRPVIFDGTRDVAKTLVDLTELDVALKRNLTERTKQNLAVRKAFDGCVECHHCVARCEVFLSEDVVAGNGLL